MAEKPKKFSPEVRERAVTMVFEQRSEHESQWAAIESIASKIGCTAAHLALCRLASRLCST
jgi:transposase-like protein